jgi:hypothetical protein
MNLLDAQTPKYKEAIREHFKRFPMQAGQGCPGPTIDWQAAEEIYKMYSKLYGTSQSLEMLADRGGFGWSEVEIITKEYKKRFR